MPALSQSSLGFGVNALSFFEFQPPSSEADRQVVDSLMGVYGARDIFMGFAVNIASFFGTRKSLGLTLISIGAVAFVYGLVCWSHEQGEWNHWEYAPIVTVIGILLMGAFDRIRY